MEGMAEVGRLFNNNELIVAEVLQSAEAMKAAVGHLEQFMEKADTNKRARVILATVKGDVHDIGKNLVEIVLKNNGYDVINLGIKVPPDDLIRAFREHQPDAIGLSGLLVKSAEQMAITAADLREAGIEIPLARGRRGAFRQVHAAENCAALRASRVLREGRDERARPHEPVERSGAARGRAAGARAGGRGGGGRTARGDDRCRERGALAARARGHSDSACAVPGREGASGARLE